jgi:glycosyltransferase involved in cell wall biosynthesis
MHILVATDAWHPQINGVLRTLTAVEKAAGKLGARFTFITPEDFTTVPLPGYPEIPLAVPNPREIARRIAGAKADAIHIATEAPVGYFVRRHCVAHGIPFTTSFHTRLPDYVSARLPIPARWTWSWLRRFHNAGCGVMAATPALAAELDARGFRNTMLWPRGVDTAMFRPRAGADLGLKRPVFLSVGRIAVEKNLEAFLSLDLPGTTVVVGDGPARAGLEARFPGAVFLGTQEDEALARTFAAADVFVFPSRTDTFGLVLLEALASGLPVAAFPVAGPNDVIGSAPVAVLADDLQAAALKAIALPRDACRDFALRHNWDESARIFLDNIARAGAVPAPQRPRRSRVTFRKERPSVAA